jgi:hypothetical protein
MGRTVADAALLHGVMVGTDACDPLSTPAAAAPIDDDDPVDRRIRDPIP